MSPRNTEIKDMIIENAQAFEDWSARADADRAKINGNVDDLRDRVEQLEASKSNPTLSYASGETREQHEHKKLFTNWMRKPREHQTNEQLSNFQSAKALSIGTPGDGGYAVPEILLREVERFERKFSPVRDLVNVVQVASGDVRFLLATRPHSRQWPAYPGSCRNW